MSDFELLSIVLMILAIIVTLMVELFKSMKKYSPRPGNDYFFLSRNLSGPAVLPAGSLFLSLWYHVPRRLSTERARC